MTKLVLSGIALKETVEIDVSVMERGSVIPGFQPSEANIVRRITQRNSAFRASVGGFF